MLDELNKRFEHIPDYSRGRSPRAGYVRGWGLEFGGLAEKVFSDPLFIEAYNKAPRSLLTKRKLANIYLIIRYYMCAGNIVEFGTYTGGSLFFMGILAKGLGLDIELYGFDTFNGMPESDSIDLHGKGEFMCSFESVEEKRKELGLDNVHLIAGEFGENPYKDFFSVALLHVDCDIYRSVANAYCGSLSRLVSGAHIVFDDCLHGSCLSAMEAVEDYVIHRDDCRAEQTYPQLVYRHVE